MLLVKTQDCPMSKKDITSFLGHYLTTFCMCGLLSTQVRKLSAWLSCLQSVRPWAVLEQLLTQACSRIVKRVSISCVI